MIAGDSAIEMTFIHSFIRAGTIPSSLGLVKDFRHLFLGRNDFTGRMPSELCALRKLQVFDIEYLDKVCYPTCLADVSLRNDNTSRLVADPNNIYSSS
jgi:hypothetical protein